VFSFYKTAIAFISVAFCLPLGAEVIDGEDLVDPTRPFYSVSSTAATDSGPVTLSGAVSSGGFEVTFIRASSTLPLAVVNDERVTIGDLIGNAQVIGIDRGGVDLLIEGTEERRVELFSESIKETVDDR
jgi:hypothetical protein|tara:strand:+ start:142 stop:528 length:387 start_codon:yes stop_codon:yes gene_type:complete